MTWRISDGNFARKNLADYARHAEAFFKADEKPSFLHINYPDAHDPFFKQADGLPKNPLPRRLRWLTHFTSTCGWRRAAQTTENTRSK